MIKKIGYIVLLFTALLVTSCIDDDVDSVHDASRGYSFALSLQVDGVVATRSLLEAGSDDLNENIIERVDLFFYDGETLVWQVPESALTMTDGVTDYQKKMIIKIPNERGANFNGKNLNLIAITNGPITTVMTGKTLTQLKQISFESSLMNTIQLTEFLMDGNKQTGIIDLIEGEAYNLGSVSLKRVASKIRLKLKSLAVDGYVAGTPSAKLINYHNKTNLLAAPSEVYSSLKSTAYQALQSVTVDGNSFFTTLAPYYSYENDWSNDGSRETYMLLKIPFTGGEALTTVDYYYRIPINYRLENSLLQRNHLYEVTVNISELGDTTGEVPFDISSSVEVKPWETIDIIHATISKPNYLVVKESYVVMPNVAEVKIEYISNSNVIVVPNSLKAIYTAYNVAGNPINGSPTAANMPKVTFITEANKKYIKVSSPIPSNFVPLNIKFSVINQGGLVADVELDQYPLRYVTAKKSNGVYYKGAEAGPGPTHTNKNLFKVTTVIADEGSIIGDPVAPNDATGKTMDTDEANKIISPQFIIASQNGVTLARRYSGGTGHAVGRCENYYEDDYGPGRPRGGRWRLPTRAEIQYIQALQKNTNSAVEGLLLGTAYWSAKSFYYYNFNGNGSWSAGNTSSTANIRCVYDIYKYE